MAQTTSNYEAGMIGQQAAERFLLSKGYKILDRNYSNNTGEIDLIAIDGRFTVFVEVKLRRGLSYGYPREAVSSAKQKRIIRTAQSYIASYGLTDSDIRFDVVEVLKQHGVLYASHIENAFEE